MAQKSRAASAHRTYRGSPPGWRLEITLPLVGKVTPPPERVIFYTTLGLLTAFKIIELPVALIVGIGHLLADQRFSRVLQEAGEAAEAA